MQRVSGRFVVYFEDPFWVGVYERTVDGKMEACKVTFGAEPKDGEVFAFLLENRSRMRFSPAVDGCAQRAIGNPKRARRAAARQTHAQGMGTKAQQALAMMREESKAKQKKEGRARREEEKRARFALRQRKKKEKKKGR